MAVLFNLFDLGAPGLLNFSNCTYDLGSSGLYEGNHGGYDKRYIGEFAVVDNDKSSTAIKFIVDYGRVGGYLFYPD